jgi:hypothetical protein
MSEDMIENVQIYGQKILYVRTACDIIAIYTRRPNIRTLQVEDTGSSSGSSDSEYDYVDLINEIASYATRNIHLETIAHEHWRCVGNTICGCGCDEINDGISGEYCDPYPEGCYEIS